MPHFYHDSKDIAAAGFADLAMAIITLTVHDLQGGPSARRASAREAARAGALLPWLDLMALTADQRRRVQALLDELVH